MRPAARIALAALLLAALSRYVALSALVHPFADDFSYAAVGMRTDLLPRLLDEYRHWNGRWFSNILVLRSPLVLGIDPGLALYRGVPLVLLGLTYGGLWALVAACGTALRRGDQALLAGGLLLLYLHLMPDLSEGLYWYTGAVSYLLPGALSLLVAAAWIRSARRHWRLGWAATAAVGLLAVVASGCSELHMMVMAAGHAALLGLAWRRQRAVPLPLAAVLLAVLAAAFLMAAAPGNAVRGANFPLRHDALRTVGWAAVQSMRFAFTWLSSPALLAASFIYLAGGETFHARIAGAFGPIGMKPWRLAAILGLTLFAAMALPYWATGLLGQHRTVNAVLLVLLPGWFLLLSAVRVSLVEQGRWRWAPWPSRMKPLAFAVLLASVLFTGSGGRVTGDLLSGRMARFDAALVDRYARIIGAQKAGARSMTLPALADQPRSLRYLDAGSDAEGWINRSLTGWLGAGSLRIIVPAD